MSDALSAFQVERRDLPAPEIGTHMGRSTASVAGLLRRGVKQLREELKDLQ